MDSDSENDITEEFEEVIPEIKGIRVVDPDDRYTSHIIQPHEITEAIGTRISQIEGGSNPFTDVTGYTTAKQMAIKEFRERKSPLKLRRHVATIGGIQYVEEFLVREMIFPNTFIFDEN